MKRGLRVLTLGAVLALATAPTLANDAPHTTKARLVGAKAADPGPVRPPVEPSAYSPMTSLAPLVEAVEPAVAAIKIQGEARVDPRIPPVFREFLGEGHPVPRPRKGEGSGFVISADGLMLTNAHVVEGATSITAVFSDGTEAKATVLGKDSAMDVAVLRLEGDRSWPWLELGTSGGMRVGDWVVAMGNPLGLGHTVTAGIVSGKGRVLGHDVFGNESFIQTDAAINQGNSGGPLFDLQGRVVGITTAIMANANTVGFAIPIDLVKGVLDDLTHKGKVARGYLGVRPQPLDKELARALSVDSTKGALISQVFRDTPAAKSGLEDGDVIVRVDDKDIDGPNDLVAAVGNRRPGEAVMLGIVRNGKPKEIRLVLAERPGEDEPASAPVERSSEAALGKIGVGLREIPASVAAELGVSRGVLVESVVRGGAADGRVRPGDVILEVNRRPVKNAAEVARLVERSQGTVTLLIVRDQVQMFVPLTLSGR